MVNITHKIYTLRTATAQAAIHVSNPDTIQAIHDKKVPKGDVYTVAKTAAILAAKRTSDLIPDCHPIPIEYADITINDTATGIIITTEIHTIYKTGVEVEAMHAASVAALTIYDMLKPIDDQIIITEIKLIQKSGGSSDNKYIYDPKLTAAVIICSNAVYHQKKENKISLLLAQKLAQYQINVILEIITTEDKDLLHKHIHETLLHKPDMLIIAGSTGIGKNDIAAEVLRPMLEKPIPGVEEAMRSYGQLRTPYAMFSRSVAGLIHHTLALSIPGSSSGAIQSIDAIFPSVMHIFKGIKK
ncbi:MAG: bifunctional molybdenum cofactor biosynthesis protein MoaC/MoaB [Cytophagales bacterium]|nr:bifunctional molybdenum cofactor biosynthesis protein MoaC/MoaB [Cytophagales bacterium]